MKFKLRAEFTEPDETAGHVVVAFEGETLEDILPGIERFLRGVGFAVEQDTLLIKDDVDSP